ncbi:DUF6177 family protein [Streptomyces longwoodensis]|uniref:DUF6177 family protein n=1 Tax=Streptomyces longwoodensis TaxID=68231 RepID=UPI003252AB92
MAQDVIVLTPKMPDPRSLLVGLFAGGPGLSLTEDHSGGVVQLCSPDGVPLVAVDAPLLVHTPGEAERLLGPKVTAPPLPYWWTETRASSAVPEATPLAGSVGGRLTTLLGGAVWPRQTATTRTVEIPGDRDRTDTARHDGLAASVDVLTESTAVVLSDRPVLPLTTRLADTLRTATAANRGLHLVTPPHTRLTLPLRRALSGSPNRWVVQDPLGGYYDGSSGIRLAWRDGTFTAATDTEPPMPPVTSERRLTLTFRTVHAPDADLTIGLGLEAAWRHLTGAPPVGWSTAEPVNLPWSPAQLTDLARTRAPGATHVVVIGDPVRPSIATLRVSRTTAGVAQDVTLSLGYVSPTDVPLDAVEPLAAHLVAEHRLTTMLTTLQAGRSDLTFAPGPEAPPVPVSFTLGARDVHSVGLDHAGRPPLPTPPRRLGRPNAPALHYLFADGPGTDPWTQLRRLTEHLESA